MSEAASAAAVPAKRGRRGVRRVGLFVLAFVAMATIAVASMVRFTGPVTRSTEREAASQRAASAARAATSAGLVLPVQGATAAGISDTWEQSRDGGARLHHGTDIMAPAATPVLAAAAGTIEKLFDSRAGGRTIYVRSRDGRWSYYYAHLAEYAAGLHEGQAVQAGDTIGYVGDTGNAGAGNYHLHCGVSRMTQGDRWWGGTPVNPYPLLVGSRGSR